MSPYRIKVFLLMCVAIAILILLNVLSQNDSHYKLVSVYGNKLKTAIMQFSDDDGFLSQRFKKELTFREEASVNKDSILLYKAYYDPRDTEPRIRVSFNGKCDVLKKNMTIEVNGVRLSTTKEAVTGGCPDGWAPGCKYNGFDMISGPYNGTIPSEVTVHLDGQNATMPVERVTEPSELEDGITICIEPFYWFNDYIRLLVFLETWKLHGAKKFLFYSTTMNENMAKVLEAYVLKGEVDVREWPLMPRSNNTDPNARTYQLMEHLVEHDCTFRAQTKYGAIIDVDEFILPKAKETPRIIDVLNDLVKRIPNAGSFLFGHTGILYDPLLVNDRPNEPDFLSGILKPIGFSRGGPAKVIFRTEFIKVQQTHLTRRLYRGKRRQTVGGHVARLFHARNSYAEMKKTESDSKGFPHVNNFIPLPKEKHEEFRQSIITLAHEILGDELPVVNREVQRVLNKCNGQWRKTMHNCKIPVTGCVSVVEKLDTWLYAPESEDSRYTIL